MNELGSVRKEAKQISPNPPRAVFLFGDINPQSFESLGIRQKFVDTYPQILEICECRMLRLAFQRGDFRFA